MKCRVCGGPAVIKVERYTASFCPEHYTPHIHRQIERVIRKFGMFTREDRVPPGVSGGKDSMGLRHARETGFDIVVTGHNLDHEAAFSWARCCTGVPVT